MSAPDLIVRSRRILTSAELRPAAIHIRGGIITAVLPFDDLVPNSPLFDAGDSVVFPGLVDTHVHSNEPGRADWEGFASATRAAAAGGVTTLIEMPLNSIPATTTLPAFYEKIAAAENKCSIDVGFWAGVVPGNAAELEPLFAAGAFGFKCFLVPSGVPEFAHVTEQGLRAALPILASLNAPLLVHAELPAPLDLAVASLPTDHDPRAYRSWLAARPAAAETAAIDLLIELAEEFRARIHVVHLSAFESLEKIRRAISAGLSLSAETCPHYLTFAAEDIPDGATEFKCAPAIRSAANRELLWSALREGLLSMIVTDHSPCPPALKSRDAGDFLRAWGGISSLQWSLPAVWTEARRRNHPLPAVANWMCSAPAQLAGLPHRKGTIAPGLDADLCIWNPEKSFLVDPAASHHRHPLTPYAGRTLFGVVETTFLRGKRVFHRGQFAAAPSGKILLRGRA